MLIDFGDTEETNNWTAINDAVMGGVSQGRIAGTPAATAVFSGQLSLENSGGFASIRRRIDHHSLEGCAGVMLKVKGDGRTYQFRVKTDQRYDGISYRSLFVAESLQWQIITLKFDDFSAVFRGRNVLDAPVLNAAAIRQVGLLLADKRQGPFSLEIAWIKSCE